MSWLRDTIGPLDVTPPPDLADRAERTARRIVRRRVAAGVLAVVAVVVLPLAVQRGTRGPDRTAGPAPSGRCVSTAHFGPAEDPERARTAADAAWPYRGDGDMLSQVRAAGNGLTDVRPLFGTQVAGIGPVLMVAGRGDLGWRLRYVVGTDSTEQALPALHAGTQLSLVLGSSTPYTLVVVAAPGTPGIVYRYCLGQDGSYLRQHEVAADTAVIPLRSEDEVPGALAFRASPASVTEYGQPGTGYRGGFTITDRLDPIPVPAGHRPVGTVVEDRGQLTWQGYYVENARVLVRCRKPVQWESNPMDLLRSIRCDGLVHVVADGVAMGPDQALGTRFADDQVEVLVVVPM
jgi:hypothetical protein